MKLNEIKIGETFKIGGIEFIKFTDGDEVIAVSKDILFNSSFGNNSNFATSKIKTRLENEILSKIEAEIGAENIIQFETDMTALDGTKLYNNFNSKISLVTLDFYRQHREIFEKYKSSDWWWLSTAFSTPTHNDKSWILCVSPNGFIINYYFNFNLGVRPVLRFVSSIFVSE